MNYILAWLLIGYGSTQTYIILLKSYDKPYYFELKTQLDDIIRDISKDSALISLTLFGGITFLLVIGSMICRIYDYIKYKH